jgi:glyoxylase-like metal-dependent hydrolase (beta-lactamase superfamily II)
MDIQSFYESGTGTWSHLLADPEHRAAAIIDPVWVYDPVSGQTSDAALEPLLQAAERSGYQVQWVLETHAHADHLTGAARIRRVSGARIACSRGICQVQENFARVFNMRGMAIDGSQFDRLLVEGDRLQLGGLEIEVMETPGHTSDSLTYRVGDAAFVGDTLFAPAYGTARCDFPGGDAGQLYDSIRRICSLPPDTRLFLCHDYPAEGQEPVAMVTVAQTRADNIHVHADVTREEFVAMRTQRDDGLGLPKLILPSLQVNILAGDLPPADPNGVHYLTTPVDRTIESLIREDR